MGKLVSNQVIQGGERGVMTVTVSMSSGTVTLQALAGNDPDNDTWVNVPDGAWSASTQASFYAPPSQKYRFVLTGDATGWVSG